jgi:hypothetical protein
MTKLTAIADLWTSPGVVVMAAVILGCIVGCAIGELRERGKR